MDRQRDETKLTRKTCEFRSIVNKDVVEESKFDIDLVSTVSRSYDVVPDWKRRINACESATGGLFLVSDEVSSCHLYLNEHYVSPNDVYFQHIFSGPYPEDLSHLQFDERDSGYGRSERAALNAWTRKVLAAQGEMKALVTAGEAMESRRMIEGRARQLVGVTQQYMERTLKLRKKFGIRRGKSLPKGKVIRSYLQEQNSMYLEYTFGWNPLVKDVIGWSNELEKNPFRAIRHHDLILSRKSDVLTDSTDYVFSSLGRSFTGYTAKKTTALIYSTKYYGAFLYEAGATSSVLGGAGLLPRDFVPSLWELVPYSFVLDYFTNLGTVLNAFCAGSGRLAWSQTTQVRKLETTLSGMKLLFPPSEMSDLFPSGFSADCFCNYRRVTQTVARRNGTPTDTVPELEFKVPSGHQIINSLALFNNKFKTFRKLL